MGLGTKDGLQRALDDINAVEKVAWCYDEYDEPYWCRSYYYYGGRGYYRGGRGFRGGGRGGFRGGGRGGFRGGRGGGGGRGGRGGGGRGGGGRRSDITLKHDIVLLGHLDNGLGFYRFSYNGSDKAYVGVMAQEVQTVRPDAVTVGSDGYLRVYYDKLGLRMQTWDAWVAAGEKIPTVKTSNQH